MDQAALEVSDEEWERRKAFVGFTDEDAKLLQELSPVYADFADEVLDNLYERFLGFEETAAFFDGDAGIARAKALQRRYFLQLLGGDYGPEYLRGRLRVGRVHQRIGLEPRWYVGAYALYLQLVYPRLLEALSDDVERAERSFMALAKLILLDQELALSTYAAVRERRLRLLADEILEVSTPVVELWRGVIAVPLIGSLDTHRAQMFMERTLEAIVEREATFAIVDITGVPTMDTRTAQHLLETVGAVRLLGAQLILTGVRPSIAQTLVQLGIDFHGIVTRSSLSAGLSYALRQLGVRLEEAGDGDS